MKNILFITASLGFGGAAKMLAFVAEELSKRGHNVSICNLKSTCDVTNYERVVDERIKVFPVTKPENGGNVHSSRLSEIKRIAKEEKADVIIGFTGYPNMYAKIVGSMLGIPSIMSERGDPTRTIGKNLKSRISLFLINRSKGGVFQTDGAKAFYEQAKKAVSGTAFKLLRIKKEYDLTDPDQAVKYCTKAAELLKTLNNEIEKDRFVRLLSKETGISAESIAAQMGIKRQERYNIPEKEREGNKYV